MKDKVTNEDVLKKVTEDKQILNAVWQQKTLLDDDDDDCINYYNKEPTNFAQRCRLFAVNEPSCSVRWKCRLRINKSSSSHVQQSVTRHSQAVMLAQFSRLRSILKRQQPHQLRQWILHIIHNVHQSSYATVSIAISVTYYYFFFFLGLLLL